MAPWWCLLSQTGCLHISGVIVYSNHVMIIELKPTCQDRAMTNSVWAHCLVDQLLLLYANIGISYDISGNL